MSATTKITTAAKINIAMMRATRTPSSRVSFLARFFLFGANNGFFLAVAAFFLGAVFTESRITFSTGFDNNPAASNRIVVPP
jgi:hypothetical protein